MEFAYDLSGTSTAFTKKYQVAATNTVLGVPYLQAAADGTGIVLGTTTGAASPYFLASSPPITACDPSISCETALPISCKSPARRASF